MYSSRIIRGGGDHPPLTLGPLAELPPAAADEPFRAVRLGEAQEPEEPETAEEQELPPEPPTMPEAEALARIGEAYDEGLREGKAQAEAELESAAAALAQALAATDSLRAQVLHEAEEDLLKLAVLIARRVLLREFACDPAIMAGVVRCAVDVASEGASVLVRLNPEEYQVVAGCRPFEELLRENPKITLKGDPSVARAGCLVETARGIIDAGLDAQLDEILRRLAEEKSARREEPSDD